VYPGEDGRPHAARKAFRVGGDGQPVCGGGAAGALPWGEGEDRHLGAAACVGAGVAGDGGPVGGGGVGGGEGFPGGVPDGVAPAFRSGVQGGVLPVRPGRVRGGVRGSGAT